MITLFQNYTSKPAEGKIITLENLLSIFSTKDTDQYISKLRDVGYINKINSLHRWSHKAMLEKKWDHFKNFPFLLTFFLNDVYSPTITDYTKIIDIQNCKKTIDKSDFTNISLDFPEHIFDLCLKNFRKGVYDAKKMLSPSFVNVTYTDDAEKKDAKFITRHSEIFCIDIDIKIDNKYEVIEKVRKLFGLYTYTYSPSGVIRPIIRMRCDDKLLKNVAKWLGKEEKFSDIKTELLELYHSTFFNYVSETLRNETIESNGIEVPFLIDQACSNPNRLWYITRVNETLSIDTDAKINELTEEQFMLYKSSTSVKNKLTKINSHELENILITDLSHTQLEEIRKQIIDTTDKIVELCTQHNYQPLYNGNMYDKVRDLMFSISPVCDEITLKYVFTEFFKLSRLDTRLTKEYRDRTFENYVKTTTSFYTNKNDKANSYLYIFKMYNEIKEKFSTKLKYNIVRINKDGDFVLDSFERERFITDILFRIDGSVSLWTKQGHLVECVCTFNKDIFNLWVFLKQKLRELLKPMNYEEEKIHKILKIVVDTLDIRDIEKMEFRNFNSSDIERDTVDTIFLFFKNGKLKITKDTTELIQYSETDFIFKNNMVRNKKGEIFDYVELDYTKYRSIPFYEKVAGDEHNYLFLRCLIGYTTSTYRSSNDCKVVFCLDGIENSDKGGGTGKSLVMRNTEYLRSTYTITNPTNDKYIWSGLRTQTNVYLNDVQWNNFSIEGIKPFTDLDLTCEAKNVNPWQLRYDNCPKLSISSNFTPNMLHESFLSRLIYFYPSSFFNRLNNPADLWLQKIYDLKNPYKILEYTTLEEWQLWACYMVHCIQCFLIEGIDKFSKMDKMELKIENESDEYIPFQVLEEVIDDLLSKSLELFGTHAKILSSVLNQKYNNKLREKGYKVIDRLGSRIKNKIITHGKNLGFDVKYYNKNYWNDTRFIGFVFEKKIENKNEDC